MKQLNIFCEGQTEQLFCRQVLQPHLFPQGAGVIHTLAVGEKNHHHLYGLGAKRKYQGAKGVRQFILNTINRRRGGNVYFTTFFDLYALPNDFPGKTACKRNAANPTPYVVALETAFRQDINNHRFIANLVLHEYETILFADPDKFRVSFQNCDEEIEALKSIAASVPSIEHINDGKESAPSKRIIDVFGEDRYRGMKTAAGPDIASAIGLPTIRAACPHFDGWLRQLETIPWEA